MSITGAAELPVTAMLLVFPAMRSPMHRARRSAVQGGAAYI